ncbi:unnamed protein product, partial [Gulo gulo]
LPRAPLRLSGAPARALHSPGPLARCFRRHRPGPSDTRSHHVFASRGEARDESRTPARRESWWNAHCAETPTFRRHQRRERQGRPGVGKPQPAQADRVHLWCHRPGRQGLPSGGRAGGSPEAPRLHRQAPVPENPAHPAASQVRGETQCLQQQCLSFPTFRISSAEKTGIFFKNTAPLGNLRPSQVPPPLP